VCGDLVHSSFSLDVLSRDQDGAVCVVDGHAELFRLEMDFGNEKAVELE
jgi:hypothetical protein